MVSTDRSTRSTGSTATPATPPTPAGSGRIREQARPDPEPPAAEVGTPIYDAVVQEMGDPAQRGKDFDQALVDLDAYIDQTLHGDPGGNTGGNTGNGAL